MEEHGIQQTMINSKRNKYKKTVCPHVFGRSDFSISLPGSDKTYSSVFSASCSSTQTIFSYNLSTDKPLQTISLQTTTVRTSSRQARYSIKRHCEKSSTSADNRELHFLHRDKSFISTNNHSTLREDKSQQICLIFIHSLRTILTTHRLVFQTRNTQNGSLPRDSRPRTRSLPLGFSLSARLLRKAGQHAQSPSCNGWALGRLV